eukprot:5708147-Pyramimonas_sp.AAC.1
MVAQAGQPQHGPSCTCSSVKGGYLEIRGPRAPSRALARRGQETRGGKTRQQRKEQRGPGAQRPQPVIFNSAAEDFILGL